MLTQYPPLRRRNENALPEVLYGSTLSDTTTLKKGVDSRIKLEKEDVVFYTKEWNQLSKKEIKQINHIYTISEFMDLKNTNGVLKPLTAYTRLLIGVTKKLELVVFMEFTHTRYLKRDPNFEKMGGIKNKNGYFLSSLASNGPKHNKKSKYKNAGKLLLNYYFENIEPKVDYSQLHVETKRIRLIDCYKKMGFRLADSYMFLRIMNRFPLVINKMSINDSHNRIITEKYKKIKSLYKSWLSPIEIKNTLGSVRKSIIENLIKSYGDEKLAELQYLNGAKIIENLNAKDELKQHAYEELKHANILKSLLNSKYIKTPSKMDDWLKHGVYVDPTSKSDFDILKDNLKGELMAVLYYTKLLYQLRSNKSQLDEYFDIIERIRDDEIEHVFDLLELMNKKL